MTIAQSPLETSVNAQMFHAKGKVLQDPIPHEIDDCTLLYLEIPIGINESHTYMGSEMARENKRDRALESGLYRTRSVIFFTREPILLLKGSDVVVIASPAAIEHYLHTCLAPRCSFLQVHTIKKLDSEEKVIGTYHQAV